ARAVPELQDVLPVSRRRLRRGGARARAVRGGRLPHVHPRRAPGRRRSGAHAGRLCAGPRDPHVPELLQDWVTLQAGRRPDAPAVLGGTDALTYGGLEDLSNRVASALKEEGCLKGDRVCLLMPKSPTAIACLLGIYKADCLYVPLDPGCPALRLGMIIASCESRFILAAGPVGPILD